MKWTKRNDYSIQSGPYRITKFTLSGVALFQVYHGDELIGDASDGNRARQIAKKHSERTTA